MVINYIVFPIDVSKSAYKSWGMLKRTVLIVRKKMNTFTHYVGDEADMSLNIFKANIDRLIRSAITNESILNVKSMSEHLQN